MREGCRNGVKIDVDKYPSDSVVVQYMYSENPRNAIKIYVVVDKKVRKGAPSDPETQISKTSQQKEHPP